MSTGINKKFNLTQWMRESNNFKLKDYLLSLSSSTGEEMVGKFRKINCLYQALIQNNNENTIAICCHPNFLYM